jgi:hypothetical protein
MCEYQVDDPFSQVKSYEAFNSGSESQRTTTTLVYDDSFIPKTIIGLLNNIFEDSFL